MNFIELSDTTVSKDCVLIWNYLKSNPGITLSELKENFGSKKWTTERKWARTFCSNLIYVLKRLRKINAVEIIQNRNSGGEFDYATIILLSEPIIKKDLNICIECNAEFNKKSLKSKYKDLCLSCTERKFMTAKNALCVYCKAYGTRKKMRSFMSQLYHQECYRKYSDIKREAKAEATKKLREKRNYCVSCSVAEIRKSAKFCKDCLSERLLYNKKIKNCEVCGIELSITKGISRTCQNINCLAIAYSKSDTYFNGRKSDNSMSFLVKKKILGESCAVCGYDSFVNYHHVIFRENGGQDVMSNILPLCPNHHMEVHHRGLDVSQEHSALLQRLDDISNGKITISIN
jgi:5-methylcytosine-specific restriction endonuclease McrA